MIEVLSLAADSCLPDQEIVPVDREPEVSKPVSPKPQHRVLP
jgi:hypothetical protein